MTVEGGQSTRDLHRAAFAQAPRYLRHDKVNGRRSAQPLGTEADVTRASRDEM